MSQAEPPAPAAPLTRIPFSPRAEASIRALSGWMHVAGVVSVIAAFGKFGSTFSPRFNPGHLVDAVITLLVGIWVYQAGTAFRLVATTDTADQRYLMDGFMLLRKVFLLQSILLIISLAFLALGLVVATVYLLGTARG